MADEGAGGVEGQAPRGGPSAPRPALPVRLARYSARYGRSSVRWARDARMGTGLERPIDEGRDLSRQHRWSACYAPLTTMYFDQFGKVRACCQNTGHLMGDVTESTLEQIWASEAAVDLRVAVKRGRFDLGCDFCAWQMDEAGPEGSFARSYDGVPAGHFRRRWPVQMEFSVTNTCNLRCMMCNGDWSSSIRSQREHRPPLPEVYGERFYRELVPFVPHLRFAKFTGGEPFLGREPMRILGLLDEHGHRDLEVVVVTNATIMTPRVVRLLDTLPISPSVSLDGGTRDVYEGIRVGADFDEVIANLEAMVEIVGRRGREVSLGHCLMVHNWETFPELLMIAERLDLYVGVNVVRFPEEHSLYHLDRDGLAVVVRGLRARQAEVERHLTGFRLDRWERELRALEGRLTTDRWPDALGIAPGERDHVVTPVVLRSRR